MAIIELPNGQEWHAKTSIYDCILEQVLERASEIGNLQEQLQEGLRGYNFFSYKKLSSEEIQELNSIMEEVYKDFKEGKIATITEEGLEIIEPIFDELIKMLRAFSSQE